MLRVTRKNITTDQSHRYTDGKTLKFKILNWLELKVIMYVLRLFKNLGQLFTIWSSVCINQQRWINKSELR
jgi:hypothetical protein